MPDDETQVIPQGEADRPAETQHEARHDPGRRVEDQVDDAARGVTTQRARELRRRELQSEQQQEEEDADLGGSLHETLGGAELRDAALAEDEAREEEERDGREADPLGERAQRSQQQQQDAELGEEEPDVGHDVIR